MKQRRTDKSCAETQEEIGKKNQVKTLDPLFMGESQFSFKGRVFLSLGTCTRNNCTQNE